MSLTEKDLRAIKDIVDFSIGKSEMRMDDKLEILDTSLEKKIDRLSVDLSDFKKRNGQGNI